MNSYFQGHTNTVLLTNSVSLVALVGVLYIKLKHKCHRAKIRDRKSLLLIFTILCLKINGFLVEKVFCENTKKLKFLGVAQRTHIKQQHMRRNCLQLNLLFWLISGIAWAWAFSRYSTINHATSSNGVLELAYLTFTHSQLLKFLE